MAFIPTSRNLWRVISSPLDFSMIYSHPLATHHAEELIQMATSSWQVLGHQGPRDLHGSWGGTCKNSPRCCCFRADARSFRTTLRKLLLCFQVVVTLTKKFQRTTLKESSVLLSHNFCSALAPNYPYWKVIHLFCWWIWFLPYTHVTVLLLSAQFLSGLERKHHSWSSHLAFLNTSSCCWLLCSWLCGIPFFRWSSTATRGPLPWNRLRLTNGWAGKLLPEKHTVSRCSALPRRNWSQAMRVVMVCHGWFPKNGSITVGPPFRNAQVISWCRQSCLTTA